MPHFSKFHYIEHYIRNPWHNLLHKSIMPRFSTFFFAFCFFQKFVTAGFRTQNLPDRRPTRQTSWPTMLSLRGPSIFAFKYYDERKGSTGAPYTSLFLAGLFELHNVLIWGKKERARAFFCIWRRPIFFFQQAAFRTAQRTGRKRVFLPFFSVRQTAHKKS